MNYCLCYSPQVHLPLVRVLSVSFELLHVCFHFPLLQLHCLCNLFNLLLYIFFTIFFTRRLLSVFKLRISIFLIYFLVCLYRCSQFCVYTSDFCSYCLLSVLPPLRLSSSLLLTTPPQEIDRFYYLIRLF